MLDYCENCGDLVDVRRRNPDVLIHVLCGGDECLRAGIQDPAPSTPIEQLERINFQNPSAKEYRADERLKKKLIEQGLKADPCTFQALQSALWANVPIGIALNISLEKSRDVPYATLSVIVTEHDPSPEPPPSPLVKLMLWQRITRAWDTFWLTALERK